MRPLKKMKCLNMSALETKANKNCGTKHDAGGLTDAPRLRLPDCIFHEIFSFMHHSELNRLLSGPSQLLWKSKQPNPNGCHHPFEKFQGLNMDIFNTRIVEAIQQMINGLDETGTLAQEFKLDESEKWDYFVQPDIDFGDKEYFESVLRSLAIDPTQDPREFKGTHCWMSIDKKVLFVCANEIPDEHGSYGADEIVVLGLKERVCDCIRTWGYFLN